MQAVIQHAESLRGTLSLPPDKAISHRAVLAAALATGQTTISPWPEADDCQRTLGLVEQLGAPVARAADEVVIEGRGGDGLRSTDQPLDCGESGTTFRLAAGVLAGQPFVSHLVAGPSLSGRPMRRIVAPLSEMGARFEGASRSIGGRDDVCPPLTVHGRRPLRPIRYEMPVASAQVKSAILFAGLAAEGRTAVVETHSTRDHTERLLDAFGARLHRDGLTVSIESGPLVTPGRVVLPGDFSSAAFWIVAASCVAGSSLDLADVGLNPTRTGLLAILTRMGASLRPVVTQDAWEPRGTLRIEARSLRATTVAAAEVPGVIDELPILMVAAACAQGTTRFQGVSELRVKETDRIRSMAQGLQRMGAAVRLPASDMVEITGGPLTGAAVDSAGDHRTAMSLAVAGLTAQGTTVIQGAECIAKSYPGFFDALRRVAGSTTVKTVDKA